MFINQIKRMKKLFLFRIFWLCSNFVSKAEVKARVKYEYFSQGEIISLKCMSNAKTADWSGPAQDNISDASAVTAVDIYGKEREWNISLYANGEKINPSLPHKNRLKIDGNKETGDFNLQIRNVSKKDEGLYICLYTEKNESVSTMHFVLQKKTYPSTMVFENTTKDNIINGIQFKALTIKCNVEKGKPPETLSLIRLNETVKTGGHGHIEYTFKPTKLDHNVTYTCEAKSPLLKQPLKKNVRINIKYKPKVSIMESMTVEINEGEKKNLCFSIDSNPASTSTIWYNGSHNIFAKQNNRNICYPIGEVSRYDHGNYTCIAENEVGSDSASIILKVKYPPDVHLDYKNFTIHDELRKIQCEAEGYPANYMYGIWEHRSDFNEHIRYLNSTDNGTLILPRISEASNKYQDSGNYICMATNGIPNKQHFQQGKSYVVSEGPPVFVNQNSAIQYGVTGKNVIMRVYILSYSKIKCIAIKAIDGIADVTYLHDTYSKPLKVLDIFHGQIISVNGIEVEFVFARLEHKHFRMYRITVCNTFGNESYTLNLVPKADDSSEEKAISSEENLKERYRKRMITTATDQIADSAHYMEVIEDNNVLSTLQEHNNQMISTDARIVFENRNISMVSEEQHLVFSNNDSDTSEHTTASFENASIASENFDDGYERPYTSLGAHNYDEDEHVYNNTKTNSINDNSTTLQNATSAPSFALTKQDPLQNKQKTYLFADDGQENVKQNTVEYINLSLKQ